MKITKNIKNRKAGGRRTGNESWKKTWPKGRCLIIVADLNRPYKIRYFACAKYRPYPRASTYIEINIKLEWHVFIIVVSFVLFLLTIHFSFIKFLERIIKLSLLLLYKIIIHIAFHKCFGFDFFFPILWMKVSH